MFPDLKPQIDINSTFLIDNIWVTHNNNIYSVNLNNMSYKVVIDKSAPVINLPATTNRWSNGVSEMTYSNSVTDTGEAGIEYVKYSTNVADYTYDKEGAVPTTALKTATYTVSDMYATDNTKETGTWSFTETPLTSTTYYVWAKDYSGNFSDLKSFTVKIDADKPRVQSGVSSAEEHATNQPVQITGSVSDSDAATGDISGIYEVRYTTDKAAYENDTFKNSSCSKADLQDGNYKISIGNEQSISATYYIWTYDNAENKSVARQINVIIDIISPVIKTIVKTPSDEWSAGNVTISGTSEDEGDYSPTYEIRYSKDYNSYINDDNYTTVEPDATGKYSFNITQEGQADYYIWATDEAGNKSQSFMNQNVKIDNTNPKVDSFEFREKGDTTVDGFINYCLFGLFYNKPVEILVKVSDPGISSGLNSVELSIYRANGEFAMTTEPESFDEQTGIAVFTIKPLFKCTIKAEVYDNVNHSSGQVLASSVNSKTGESSNGLIMLETVSPKIEVVVTGDNENADWYSGELTFKVKFSDNEDFYNTGLYHVNASITKPDGTVKNVIDEDLFSTQIYEKEYTVKTSDLEGSHPDGEYKIDANVTDNAGNVYTLPTKSVFKDTIAPTITGFDFITDANKAVDGINTYVEEKDYGFYFMKDTKVIISANDSDPGSGVKSITYYTVSSTGTKSEAKTVDVDENNQIVITIPNGFKGQIFANASDKLNNSQENYVDCKSVIVDTQNIHYTIKKDIQQTETANIANTTSNNDNKKTEDVNTRDVNTRDVKTGDQLSSYLIYIVFAAGVFALSLYIKQKGKSSNI